jgi:hypothetical protein
MSFKQMIGLVSLSLGIVLIVFACHRMGYLPEKFHENKTFTNSPLSPTEHLPEEEGGQGEPSQDSTLVLMGGMVLFVIGVGVTIYGRK